MKHPIQATVSAIALAGSLLSCASSGPAAGSASFTATAVSIPSRGVSIPGILTVPEAKGRLPLVVMAHGHGGSKEEAGGFTAIAEALARNGIASIRVDFPGCGESVEPFTENNLDAMLADLDAARDYAVAKASVDARRIGIFGYSMGGRLAVLSTARYGYKAVALLAPVANDGSSAMYGFMGGADAYAALAAEAARSGSARFTTPFGQVQDLGARWFSDNEAARCIAAVKAYRGPIQYLHGTKDVIIAASVVGESAAAATASAAVERVTVEGADHGYGFYGGDPGIKDFTVAAIADFLSRRL